MTLRSHVEKSNFPCRSSRATRLFFSSMPTELIIVLSDFELHQHAMRHDSVRSLALPREAFFDSGKIPVLRSILEEKKQKVRGSGFDVLSVVCS